MCQGLASPSGIGVWLWLILIVGNTVCPRLKIRSWSLMKLRIWIRADEDNDDVIESFSLYHIFSVFPSFVYYYLDKSFYITVWVNFHDPYLSLRISFYFLTINLELKRSYNISYFIEMTKQFRITMTYVAIINYYWSLNMIMKEWFRITIFHSKYQIYCDDNIQYNLF